MSRCVVSGCFSPKMSRGYCALHIKEFAEEKSVQSNISDSDRIQVCVRMRPINEYEREQDFVWNLSSNTVCLKHHVDGIREAASFAFDRVFGAQDATIDIFETMVDRVVCGVMDMFNGTVFCYGQTGSGKTYTMMGTESDPGIIPQSVDRVFNYIGACLDKEFVIRVSYLEIHNESVNDLLAPERINLRICEDRNRGVVVDNAKEEPVVSGEHIMSLLMAGEAFRHTGATNMNESSSRSHTIFRLIIESSKTHDSLSSRKDGKKSSVCTSVLNLIDLAGSEGGKATEGLSQEIRQESAFINKSLLTLGTVIYRLSQNQPKRNSNTKKTYATHIPFRDSKLTYLLKSSLSGDARVIIIANCSPTIHCAAETISTLKFASRAKTIQISARQNMGDENSLLEQYRKEIQDLKEQLLKFQQSPQSNVFSIDAIETMEKQKRELMEKLLDQRAEKEMLQERIHKLERLILKSSVPFAKDRGIIRRFSVLDDKEDPIKLRTISADSISSQSLPKIHETMENTLYSPHSTPLEPHSSSNLRPRRSYSIFSNSIPTLSQAKVADLDTKSADVNANGSFNGQTLSLADLSIPPDKSNGLKKKVPSTNDLLAKHAAIREMITQKRRQSIQASETRLQSNSLADSVDEKNSIHHIGESIVALSHAVSRIREAFLSIRPDLQCIVDSCTSNKDEVTNKHTQTSKVSQTLLSHTNSGSHIKPSRVSLVPVPKSTKSSNSKICTLHESQIRGLLRLKHVLDEVFEQLGMPIDEEGAKSYPESKCDRNEESMINSGLVVDSLTDQVQLFERISKLEGRLKKECKEKKELEEYVRSKESENLELIEMCDSLLTDLEQRNSSQ